MTFEPNSEKNQGLTRPPARRWYQHWWVWVLAAFVAMVVVYYHLGGKPKTTAGIPPPVRTPGPAPVTAIAAQKGNIGVYLNGLGSVSPLRTVTVKSRVDGELMKVYYKEGQIVKERQLLAEIDPRPYQAQLTQAQGQMIRDKAQLANAKQDLKRYRILNSQDSIAEQQYATQKSLVNQFEGTVKLDQGQIDNAKLQLIYAKITAPVSGRIGLRLVDPGNIVHATDTTGLAVITQLEPITVIFTIPEDNLPEVYTKYKAGERLPVYAYNREQTRRLSSGYLHSLDNQIDPNSGTIKLRAEFANKDHMLFPNQFVNARLLLETRHGVILVPTGVIQRSPRGPYVYLIKPDRTVMVRQVRLGPAEGDITAIDEGLAPGDLVVLEGAERLREGSKVELKNNGNNNGKAPKGKK